MHDQLPRTVAVPAPPAAPLRVARRAAASLLRRRYDVRVHGAGRVPAEGPVLLSCNHIGLFDGPLLTAVAPRPVHALVKHEMFTGPGGWLFGALGQISVERSAVDVFAVKQAIRVLRDRGVVAVYPEGSRGRGDATHSRLGVAYLAMVTGAVVVPVAHLGTRAHGESVHAAPARGARFDVSFGEPLMAARPPVAWRRHKALVESLAEHLRVGLAQHVHDAVQLTGQMLPAAPPDADDDAAGRRGHEVGRHAKEHAS
ncbi:MAG: lysophospholipid acyltransferase family protein [Nocardioidaceae bacterium]